MEVSNGQTWSTLATTDAAWRKKHDPIVLDLNMSGHRRMEILENFRAELQALGLIGS